jgi:hypothetical protein
VTTPPEALERLKGHCPTCGADRNSEIVASYEEEWDDAEGQVYGKINHRVLKCMGCDTVFYQKHSICSEEYEIVTSEHTNEEETVYTPTINYWPAPVTRKQPGWMFQLAWNGDSVLHSLLEDIYTALDNDLRIFAAIGLRTAFDRASELLGVEQSQTFAQKLDDLLKKGKISSSERESLDVLTDAGNAAAHRGWKPSVGELDTLMTIGEQFIHRALVLEAAAKELRPRVPQRPKRPPSENTPST